MAVAVAVAAPKMDPRTARQELPVNRVQDRPETILAAPAVPRHGAGVAGRLDVLLRLLHAVRHPRPGSGDRPGPRRIVTHFMRCAAHLPTFRDWYGNPANPALRVELARRPELVTCVVHPYLNTGWSAEHKLAIIATHYALLRGPLSLLQPLQPMLLAQTEQGLHLQLERPGKFEHEGEATLHLCRDGESLYTVAFTLGQLPGPKDAGVAGTEPRVAYVGALQGLHSPDALECYRDLTHRLHGLRPRDLLVTALRQFCQALGVTQILAIGDAQRVSSNAYFAACGRVLSSYDSAWLDAGGIATADGFYALDPQLVHRSADAVPTRKRALYRRRYAMLDALGQAIDTRVHGPGHQAGG